MAEAARRKLILAGEQISLRTLPAYAQERLAAAMQYPAQNLEEHRFRLPKLDLDVRMAGSELAALCEQRFVQRECDEEVGQHATVHALDATLDGWDAPAGWDTDTGFSSREFERALEEAGLRGFYHHHAPSWQFFNPATRRGVHVLPSRMGIPPWEIGSPMRLFMHWAYAAQGLRLTHAATLGIGGKGALMVGASGSGKSGTTLAGLLNGLQSVGDDYVLLEHVEDVTAHALFRVFKQDDNGLRRVGLRLENSELNWHGKHEFDAMALMPGAFVRRLKITAIFLPHVARLERTEIEPVSAKHAALALAPSAVFQLPGDTNGAFRFFATLTRRLPAYRVSLSEDPVEIADTIANHLSRDLYLAD